MCRKIYSDMQVKRYFYQDIIENLAQETTVRR